MPYVEVSEIIPGEKRMIYQLISRMEDYPVFMKDVQSVKVLEREEKRTITDWVTCVNGMKIKWRELDEFDEENGRIFYKQLEGDLRTFQGEWCLEEVAEGVKVTLTVDFDFGVPMIAPLINPLLKQKVTQNSRAMLRAIKEQMRRSE